MPSTSPKPECMECKKLPKFDPTLGYGVKPGDVWRPATPRPIDPRSGPRSPRCHTHIEAKRKHARTVARDRHQLKTYELENADLFELEKLQGFRCPCGNRVKHTDHDHQRARELCDHDPKLGCKRCVRGRLCFICNSHILGRGYDIRRLLALVDYLRSPPARQLWGD